MFVPKCAELIRSDEERSVVTVCLDAYSLLLEELRGDVLIAEGHREAIMNCVIDVLTLKVRNFPDLQKNTIDVCIYIEITFKCINYALLLFHLYTMYRTLIILIIVLNVVKFVNYKVLFGTNCFSFY